MSSQSEGRSERAGAVRGAGMDKYKGVPVLVLERAHKRAIERMRDAQSQAALLARAIKRAKREARHNSQKDLQNNLKRPIDN